MSVQNFSLLVYYKVAEKFRGDVFNLNPSCIELELGLGFDNLGNKGLREAFMRKNRKYIGLLPIGGYTPPPFRRIGNFRFFPPLFSVFF